MLVEEPIIPSNVDELAGGTMQITTFSELTIDGKLSLGRGRSSKELFGFYGPELARWFHAQRAAHDAIMVGAGTVRADDPELTVRHVPGRNPLRVVPLGRMALDLRSTILTDGLPTLLVLPAAHLGAYEAAAVETIVCGEAQVDLGALVQKLTDRGVSSLMVEGGSRLLHSFFAQDLVDRIVIKHIPILSGEPSAPPYLDGARMALSAWDVESWERIGGIGVATYSRKTRQGCEVAA
jgi:riboflavin-specific deaminase-like protein